MVADCPPAPRAEIRLAAQNAHLGTASALIGIWSAFAQIGGLARGHHETAEHALRSASG